MFTHILNKITHYFLHRAWTQMQAADEQGIVATATDDVADFMDDYWSNFVRSENDTD